MWGSAGEPPWPELAVLEDRAETLAPGGLAELGWIESVLNVKDGLAGTHERIQQRAFVVGDALFVHREVEVTDEIGNLVEVVLETDSETPIVCELRDHPVVADLSS